MTRFSQAIANLTTPPLTGDIPPPTPPVFPRKRYRGLVQQPRPARPTETAVDLEQARQIVWDAMQEYVWQEAPTHALLVRGVPGLGKTTLGVQLAEYAAHIGHVRHILYAGPRRDLWGDLCEKIESPDLWYNWLPRQQDEHNPELTTCFHAQAMNRWLARGYEAMDFCANPRICGWDFINGGCPYHQQKETEAQIIFGQHQHLALGHPLMKRFRLLIVDENPLSAFLRHWQIPGKFVLPSGMELVSPLTDLVHHLEILTTSGLFTLTGRELIDRLGGADEVLGALGDAGNIALDAVVMPPMLASTGEVERAQYTHLPSLLNLLKREATAAKSGGDYVSRIMVRPGALWLALRHNLTEHARGKPMVILDATGSTALYEAMLGREVQTVNPHIKMQGRVFQVMDRTNTLGSVREEDARTRVRTTVDEIVARYEYKAPVVITHKKLEDAFAGYQTGHFYGMRGTNRFETCDAIFIVGAPIPPPDELEQIAAMLYFSRMKPFDTSWTETDVPIMRPEDEAEGWAYQVSGHWADPELQALVWQYREAEIVQAAHRARPAIRPVDVWLLTNIPLDEFTPTITTIRQVLNTPPGVRPFVWLAVRDWALRHAEEHGGVTTVDMQKHLGVTRPTASKYMGYLVQFEGWESYTGVRPPGRGQPPKAVRPGHNGGIL